MQRFCQSAHGWRALCLCRWPRSVSFHVHGHQGVQSFVDPSGRRNNWRFLMRRSGLCLFLCLVLGCGGSAKHEILTLDKVPEKYLQTAKEKLPDVKFESAIKRSDGVIEVRGKDPKGKVRDVEFNSAGEVIE